MVMASKMVRPLSRGQWLEHGAAVLERFGLYTYAHWPVAELPEGSRKLLDIALSFALNPQVLLMDEPTSGVSIADRFPVMDTLVTVLQQSAITTIFVEHDMDVVQWYSQRVLVFNEGQVIADGPPARVLRIRQYARRCWGRSSYAARRQSLRYDQRVSYFAWYQFGAPHGGADGARRP